MGGGTAGSCIPAEMSKLITEDPTLLTQAEIELLQQLAERRRVLEAREQELGIRSGLLAAAEKRIDKKVDELKVLRGTIAGLASFNVSNFATTAFADGNALLVLLSTTVRSLLSTLLSRATVGVSLLLMLD